MNGGRIVGYVDMSPSWVAATQIHLEIVKRPSDCSDRNDMYDDSKESRAERRRDQQGLAIAKKGANDHFMQMAEMCDALSADLSTLPKPFIEKIKAIASKYR